MTAVTSRQDDDSDDDSDISLAAQMKFAQQMDAIRLKSSEDHKNRLKSAVEVAAEAAKVETDRLEEMAKKLLVPKDLTPFERFLLMRLDLLELKIIELTGVVNNQRQNCPKCQDGSKSKS